MTCKREALELLHIIETTSKEDQYTAVRRFIQKIKSRQMLKAVRVAEENFCNSAVSSRLMAMYYTATRS